MFKDYAVLGDDVVIGEWKVARFVEQTLAELGVDIERQKSLISDHFEFAKRFRVLQGRVDLSPISIRALMAFSSPYGQLSIHRYKVQRFTTLARIGGAG